MLAILRPTKFWFFPLTRIGSCLSIAHQQSNLNSFGQYFGWSDPTGQLNYAVFAIILNNTCKLSKFENAVSLMISLTCFKLVFIDQFPRSFLQFFTVERKGKDCSDFFPLKTIMADYSVPVCIIQCARRLYTESNQSVYNRPLALRGHVTSLLWKWKLHDFAFETLLVGHL